MLGLQEWIAIQVAPVQAQAASRLLMLFVMFQMNIKKTSCSEKKHEVYR